MSPDSPYAEEMRRLESLRVDLQKLQAARMDVVHLTVEREQVTGAIAILISGISLGTDDEGDAETHENKASHQSRA